MLMHLGFCGIWLSWYLAKVDLKNSFSSRPVPPPATLQALLCPSFSLSRVIIADKYSVFSDIGVSPHTLWLEKFINFFTRGCIP